MTENRVLILGCGMIGSALAMDLSRQRSWRVTVADCCGERLTRVAAQYGVQICEADLSRPETVTALAAQHDLVVGALPSVIGFQTLRAIIESGRHAVDISFMPENALALDASAREKGVTAIVDCGVAPGLSHMMAGFAATELAPCERIDIHIGGLPAERHWPYEYKAGFSPHDVIEEYVRPARVVEHGHVVVKEALSETELIDISGVGTLEAFLTDGLRTLADTLDVPFMKEKTLRYPGHVHLMRVLRDTGFFSKEPVTVGVHELRPLDLTSALLFPKWTFTEGEADLTILRVAAEGHHMNETVRYTWTLLDRYDPATGLRSMSRVTAFPAAIVARLVANGAFEPGVHPPERVGQLGLLDVVLHELEERGVRCATTCTWRPPSGG